MSEPFTCKRRVHFPPEAEPHPKEMKPSRAVVERLPSSLELVKSVWSDEEHKTLNNSVLRLNLFHPKRSRRILRSLPSYFTPW
ncbi:hypothetical protein SCP_1101810 [Sparassis crispa]|uniref:Uncharacterized protein n=1 Tax=Sparassis crispa TaxID=139825 RepID=A0A401GZB5_9APHY|nr:hypothetical protein SCP_1101810 [Sparassis crispa]GBE87504.1 hypothetical protein SCP_1101810 [Sparassis crispa]